MVCARPSLTSLGRNGPEQRIIPPLALQMSNTGLEGYHWYYRPGVSVGAIPTNGGLTCVFASVPQRRFHDEFRDMAAGHQQVLREGPGLGDPRPRGGPG